MATAVPAEAVETVTVAAGGECVEVGGEVEGEGAMMAGGGLF